MSVTQWEQLAQITFDGKFAPQKKKSVNFKIDSMESVPQSKGSFLHKKTQNITCLPINFFHSPGQYNKMIIRCAPPVSDSFVDRRMGIIKNLQFVNQKLFQQEKEKKNMRLVEYNQKQRQVKALQNDYQHQMSSCTCCCCDNYCRQCAKMSVCDISRKESEMRKEDFLIDMQAVKRGQKPKPIFVKNQKKNKQVAVPDDVYSPHFCCQGKQKQSSRIDYLINQSLIKQIEIKREQEIQKLSKKQQKKMKEYFNQSVRELNRPHSAPKKQEVKILEPSKRQVREAYWKSVKQLVSYQLRKQKIQPSVIRIEKEEKMRSPKREFRMTMQQMQSLRILYGREAFKQEQLCKIQKKKQEKNKTKKLLALAAEQAQIIKKQKKKKFKPTSSMIENAFKNVE